MRDQAENLRKQMNAFEDNDSVTFAMITSDDTLFEDLDFPYDVRFNDSITGDEQFAVLVIGAFEQAHLLHLYRRMKRYCSQLVNVSEYVLVSTAKDESLQFVQNIIETSETYLSVNVRFSKSLREIQDIEDVCHTLIKERGVI
ncbi:hypothetical protein DH09_04840 [Bacillaceae bacterium JMAK1]|nr:hypothetical protein DH09_04840 [Bacillaceae bacterium JMAK1]